VRRSSFSKSCGSVCRKAAGFKHRPAPGLTCLYGFQGLQEQALTFRHIAWVPMQSNFPLLLRHHVVGTDYLDADKLIEGGFECLEQPRKVFRQVHDAKIFGRKLPGIDHDEVRLLKGDGEKAVQVLGRDSVQLHIAAGVEETEKAAVHRLDDFISPRDGPDAAARSAVEQEARLLENVQPFDFFLTVAVSDGPEAKGDKPVHGQLQPPVKLAVDAADVQKLSDLPASERDRLGEVVAEGEDTQGDEDVQILFGRQAQLTVPLDLPYHPALTAVRKNLYTLDFDFADGLANPAFENGERYGPEVLFLDGKVQHAERFGFVLHCRLETTKSRSLVFTSSWRR